MKRFAAVCALSVLVAACEAKSPTAPSGATPSQASTFTLSGTVMSIGHVPVSGARVEAIGLVECAGPNPDYAQYPTYPDFQPPPCFTEKMFGADETDSNGAFSIAPLPAGHFTVYVTKDGTTTSEGVTVMADATMELTMDNAIAVAPSARSRVGGR